MIIRINELEREYDIAEGRINCLIIENPDLFNKLLFLINQQLTGQGDTISIFENKKVFNKFSDLIVSPLDLKVSANALKKKLTSLLDAELEESEYIDCKTNIIQDILVLLDRVKYRIDLDISFDLPDSITPLLDACNLKLEEPDGRFLERLSAYVKCFHRLLGKSLFIIYNCASFLTANDIELAKHITEYENVTFLFIDQRHVIRNADGNSYIIDSSLCDIY